MRAHLNPIAPFLLLALVLPSAACKTRALSDSSVANAQTTPAIDARTQARVDILVKKLDEASLRYFIDAYAHGLYLDKAPNISEKPLVAEGAMASVATTGYGMAAIAHAAKFGKIPLQLADERTRASLTAIKTMLETGQHYKGWLYHFVTATAEPKRFGTCEASTIDTALFYWGAAYAVQVMKELGHDYTAELDAMMKELDWTSMMTNDGAKPQKRVLAMGWKDGHFEPADWDSYNETPILVLLGIGLGGLDPGAWWSWKRQAVPTPFGRILAGDESLFMHQFLQLFLGPTAIDDGFPDYYENSVRATIYNKWFVDQPKHAALYSGLWGLTATYKPEDGYYAYGPRDGAPSRAPDHDGTVCLSGAFSSAFLAPDIVLPSFAAMVDTYGGDFLIGKYGFHESINPSQNWRSDTIIGLSVATVYQTIAALDPERAMALDFIKVPFIQRGLAQIAANRSRYATATGL